MQTIQLEISGMMCEACQNHVSRALKNVVGVNGATVDLAAHSATVNGENLDADALISAVEEEGYSARIQ